MAYRPVHYITTADREADGCFTGEVPRVGEMVLLPTGKGRYFRVKALHWEVLSAGSSEEAQPSVAKIVVEEVPGYDPEKDELGYGESQVGR